MEVKPLHPLFAAELIGADLSRPPDSPLVGKVEQAMARYGVLAIRDAAIDDEQHKRFSRAFGPLELRSGEDPEPQPGMRHRDRAIFYAGNLDAYGNIAPYGGEETKLARGAERFHTDSSFHLMPTKWSLLLGHETPPPNAGGDTWFCDTRAAYDALPEATRRKIEGLTGVHDFWEGRRRAGLKGEITPEMRRVLPFDRVNHPLVREVAGRKALFVGGHCVGVEELPDAEGSALVDELYAHATQERFIYRHRWRQHDLLIWDNRCTMHAATPLLSDAYRRDMRRTTINESGPEISAREWMANLQAA